MSNYAVAHLDQIPEQNDGRCPYRPVRHHLGITAFGATSWTGHAEGDRIINEHDESDEPGSEELYLVMRGHAVFELDGERIDAPAGTLVFARAGAKRTAFAEEAETTIVVVGAAAGKAYTPGGWELWAPFVADYQAGKHAEVAERLRELVDSGTEYPMLVYNLACLRASPVRRRTRSGTCAARSSSTRTCATWRRRIPTSMRSGTSLRSRSSSRRSFSAHTPRRPRRSQHAL